jgi:prepilin-type N-terminal cleavage/methylation domain-containing protein
MQNAKRKTQNCLKGFTLIEMMVVVFVVGIGLVGALSFFSININNQIEAKNELIAANLAQESADLVRNLRDYNILKGNNWYNGLCLNTGSTTCDQCAAIDYKSVVSSHVCTNQTCVCLNSGRYEQCGCANPSTDFVRTVSITRTGDLDSGGYITVESEVAWNGRETSASDVLYDNSF